MTKTLPRKALISLSSFHCAIYPNGQKTGLFFTEALHPFEVLTRAGFEVDLASETGRYGLDDVSLTDPFLTGSDKDVFGDPKHLFNEGKTVTGFSVEGEMIFRILETLKSDKVHTVVEAVSMVGADYSSPMGPFDDYSITAGRVATGTNPASPPSTAERAVRIFNLEKA